MNVIPFTQAVHWLLSCKKKGNGTWNIPSATRRRRINKEEKWNSVIEYDFLRIFKKEKKLNEKETYEQKKQTVSTKLIMLH